MTGPAPGPGTGPAAAPASGPTSAPWPDRVRAAFTEALGETVTVEEGFGPLSVDVPPGSWTAAVEVARDRLHCSYFDWLSAVDELTDGFRVVCHLADHRPGSPWDR